MTWSLALSTPNAEDAVSAALTLRSIPHHIFRLRKKVAYRGRVVERLVPAFSRYVFVPYENCGTIASDPEHGGVIGVTGLVKFGDQWPEHISDAIVSELISRCPDRNDVLPSPIDSTNDPTVFRFGDRVRVTGDNSLVFGSVGVYKENVAVGKAFVLLPWFNGMTQTLVNEVDLEKIGPRSENKSESRNNRRKRRHHSRRVGKKNHIIEASAQRAS